MATSIDRIADEIEQTLTTYQDSVVAGLKKQAKDSMRQLVKKTRATAPVGRRKKHYRDSITSTKQSENARGVSYLWYVKGSDSRLSHLLNNGHQLARGGRVGGTNFITNAHDDVIADYEKAVEEVCRNGK